MKWMLALAIVGHILTGWTDCLMTFTPKGRFSFAVMGDADEMARIFDGMPLKRLINAIVFGVIGLTLCCFGYLRLAQWMGEFSGVSAVLMRVGALLLFLPGIAHHVICGTSEWFYVRLNRTRDALRVITEFFKNTSVTMVLCYVGCLLFSAALFVAVVAGKTAAPAWGCVFNPALLTLLLFALKVPAATNVGGVVALLGLLFFV